MPHKKHRTTIPVGGQVVCGSRKLRLDAVDGDTATVTLTRLKGELVDIRNPNVPDPPDPDSLTGGWVYADPGEGEMVEEQYAAPLGHKVRLGRHRQFRVFPADGGEYPVVVVGPESEIE